jgi:3-deoxy-D-manno-octulosonic-acid transferase
MPYLFNTLYLFALLLSSPWLLYKSLTTGKYRRGLWRKFLGSALPRAGEKPCAWFHGVSVGEIHLLRPVVARFRQLYPDWECVLSTTTDTGYEEACKHFAKLPVFYWPLDFSWAVRRAVRRVRPSLVVLAEGELWPNFLTAAGQTGVPVAVINGRLSPRSARRYRLFPRLARHWLSGLDLLAVQTEEYAELFRTLGASPQRVHVTGTVKYDGVQTDRDNPRTRELRELFQRAPGDVVWIAGSTQAPEEAYILEVFRQVRQEVANLRLFLVPRQRERFEEVATLLMRSGLPFVRRSTLNGSVRDRKAVVLVDTIGELGALWGLADVAFVGGSLDGRRGGQNMIEPAAYGAAVVFGPHVWNFRATADRLRAAQAAVQIGDRAELEKTLRRLSHDAAERGRLGAAARQLVLAQQGATERTLELMKGLLQEDLQRERAA